MAISYGSITISNIKDGSSVYRLIVSNAAIVLNEDGILNPSSITLRATEQSGADDLSPYDGVFKIEGKTEQGWITLYESQDPESIKEYQLPPFHDVFLLGTYDEDVLATRESALLLARAAASQSLYRVGLYNPDNRQVLLDQQEIPIIVDGANAYTIILTNESHTFVGKASTAFTSTTQCNVLAYKGAVRIPATIGTITGQPTGMTTRVKDNTNGTTACAFEVTVTNQMTTKSGVLTIPITADGISFSKEFTYSLALSPVVSTDRGQGATSTTIIIEDIDGTKTAQIPDGVTGINSATINLYRRSATSPTKPSNTLTYNFSTKALTGNYSPWETSVPDPGTTNEPLWVTVATASANTATDTIAASEWTTPTKLTSTGYSQATIYLYQRAASTPVTPSIDIIYGFESGEIDQVPSGWHRSVPTADGNPCYVISTAAIGYGSSVRVLHTEWSEPAIMAEDGFSPVVEIPSKQDGTTTINITDATGLHTATIQDGIAGINSATLMLYTRSITTPSSPQYSATYTFATKTLTGVLSPWGTSVPSGNDPIWVIVATASSNTATDEIAANEWTQPVKLTSNGYNTAVLYLYKRSSSAPAKPSINVSYTFSTGEYNTIPSGWSTSVPATNWTPCWVVTTAAISYDDTATVQASEWSDPVKMVEDGSSPTITSTVIEYAQTQDGVNAPTTGWGNKPTPIPGQYIWTKTTSTMSDGKTIVQTIATYNPIDGSKWYAGTAITGTSTTATSYNTGIANANINDIYLNTETGNAYKCTVGGNQSTAKWVYVSNMKGATGKNLTGTKDQYCLHTSTSTIPGESTTWYDYIPDYESGKYYWYRIELTWSNPSGTTYTTPIYDSAVTDAKKAFINSEDAISYSTKIFGTCNTGAGTAAKVVTCSGFKLFTGATIHVLFNNANTAANATLNVNSTGAKTIKIFGNSTVGVGAANAEKNWAAGELVTFVYDGTYWNAQSTGTDSTGVCTTAAGTANKDVTCAGFTLYTGATIRVRFTYSNSVASPTLNVNSTGAKTIIADGAAMTATSIYKWQAGDTVVFAYNGTSWVMDKSVVMAMKANEVAGQAMTAANGKNKVIHMNKTGTMPTTGFSDGDTWFATNEGYKMYSFSNGEWVAEQLDSDAIAVGAIKASNIDAGAITADKIAANALNGKTISGATLSLGGTSSTTGGDGSITMYNSSGAQIGKWDKDGLNVTSGTIYANTISGGTLNFSNFSVSNLQANYITSGTLDCRNITVSNLNADSITTGTLTLSENLTIANLTADNLEGGTLTGGAIKTTQSDHLTFTYNVSSGAISNPTSSGVDDRFIYINGSSINSIAGTSTIASQLIPATATLTGVSPSSTQEGWVANTFIYATNFYNPSGVLVSGSDVASAINSAISSYTTNVLTPAINNVESWVSQQGYITSSSLSNTYATKDWVNSTALPDYTTSVLNQAIQNFVTTSYMTTAINNAVSGLASTSWVSNNFNSKLSVSSPSSGVSGVTARKYGSVVTLYINNLSISAGASSGTVLGYLNDGLEPPVYVEIADTHTNHFRIRVGTNGAMELMTANTKTSSQSFRGTVSYIV